MGGKNPGQKGKLGNNAAKRQSFQEATPRTEGRKHGHATHHPGSLGQENYQLLTPREGRKAVLPTRPKPGKLK
jgi:hypothetical protein